MGSSMAIAPHHCSQEIGELRKAGFDHLIILNKSDKPVYLFIHDGQIAFRDASHLEKLDIHQTFGTLRQELNDRDVQIVCIGPAGRKLVAFACVCGGYGGNAVGRTGMGAVMGSKKLKAIVVRGGKKKIPMADPAALREIMQPSIPLIREDEEVWDLAKHGTLGILESQNAVGGLPTRNYRSGWMGYDRAAAIGGERLFNDMLRGAADGTQLKTGRETCYSCAVRCKRVVEAEWVAID